MHARLPCTLSSVCIFYDASQLIQRECPTWSYRSFGAVSSGLQTTGTPFQLPHGIGRPSMRRLTVGSVQSLLPTLRVQGGRSSPRPRPQGPCFPHCKILPLTALAPVLLGLCVLVFPAQGRVWQRSTGPGLARLGPSYARCASDISSRSLFPGLERRHLQVVTRQCCGFNDAQQEGRLAQGLAPCSVNYLRSLAQGGGGGRPSAQPRRPEEPQTSTSPFPADEATVWEPSLCA